MKKVCFSLIATFFLAAPTIAEEAKTQERFVIDVGGGFATYSSLTVLGGALEDFDYCNNGKCDAPNEVDYESNYTVASLGARYIFTPHIEAGLAASYEYYSSYETVCEGTDHEMYCRAGDFLDQISSNPSSPLSIKSLPQRRRIRKPTPPTWKSKSTNLSTNSTT